MDVIYQNSFDPGVSKKGRSNQVRGSMESSNRIMTIETPSIVGTGDTNVEMREQREWRSFTELDDCQVKLLHESMELMPAGQLNEEVVNLDDDFIEQRFFRRTHSLDYVCAISTEVSPNFTMILQSDRMLGALEWYPKMWWKSTTSKTLLNSVDGLNFSYYLGKWKGMEAFFILYDMEFTIEVFRNDRPGHNYRNEVVPLPQLIAKSFTDNVMLESVRR